MQMASCFASSSVNSKITRSYIQKSSMKINTKKQNLCMGCIHHCLEFTKPLFSKNIQNIFSQDLYFIFPELHFSLQKQRLLNLLKEKQNKTKQKNEGKFIFDHT